MRLRHRTTRRGRSPILPPGCRGGGLLRAGGARRRVDSSEICSTFGRPVARMADTHKKILCIEDDRETAALIAEELVDRGYEVTVAYDGREGLAAILRTMP